MEALELQEAQEGGSGLVGREGRFRATLLVQAGHGGRGDHLGPTSLAIAGRCQALASWSTSWTGRWRSVAAAEARPGYGRQDLLLVVHRTTAVGLDRGRVVRRDHQGVDVGVRDRQAEVVADEPRPLEQGSWWPAHGYCEMPSTCWPGCSGSQANCEIRAFEPTGTAPAPVSLKACSEVSMQKLSRPWSAARMLASLGQACRRS